MEKLKKICRKVKVKIGAKFGANDHIYILLASIQPQSFNTYRPIPIYPNMSTGA